jgi:hypothetical protein
MEPVLTTENWRIRRATLELDSFFFIEGDLPDAEKNGHYPRVEVMQEDYGVHNGYTHEIRMADAELIVAAPKMRKAINEVLKALDGNEVTNIEWVKKRLLESVK